MGDLGAGKTFFVKAVGEALGAKKVKSPSFVILEIHPTNKGFSLAHFDFYRLSSREIAHFEWPDYLFKPQYVSFIEWGEKLEPFLKGRDYFKITFKVASPGKRRVSLNTKLRKWLSST